VREYWANESGEGGIGCFDWLLLIVVLWWLVGVLVEAIRIGPIG